MKMIHATLIVMSIIGLTLHPSLQYGANAIMEDKMMQKLTKANVPVSVPLTKGYVNGFDVFYISTEASDEDLADHLTEFKGARVAFTPVLERTPMQSLVL
ncbi:MAG: hypothetical protein QXU32_10685 [Nitrososphaerales archaeon]